MEIQRAVHLGWSWKIIHKRPLSFYWGLWWFKTSRKKG